MERISFGQRGVDQYARNSRGKWKITGYAKLPNRLLFTEKISRTALLAYWVLAARTFNGKNSCWPSLTTIAAEAHCVKNTAIRAIKELEQLGYLRVDRSKKERRNNVYSLNKEK